MKDCSQCGRRIIVNGNKKNPKATGSKDKNHDLCQRCWKSQRDQSLRGRFLRFRRYG